MLLVGSRLWFLDLVIDPLRSLPISLSPYTKWWENVKVDFVFFLSALGYSL